MNSATDFLQRHPLIAVHLAAALLALLVGGVVMARPKGTFSHRTLGWGFVLLMGATALSSVFIRDHHLPNIAGYTPIHLFTLTTAIALPVGVRRARRRNIAGHRSVMTKVFAGGCVAAGLFTLLPGRFLGNLLWHSLLGVV